MTDTTRPHAARPHAADEAAWTVIVAASSVLFSFAFACATPFAALAAVAATRMRRDAGVAAVLLAWAGNQAIGFGLLHYPRTPHTFAWGAAIGVASLVALVAAGRSSSRIHPVARIVFAWAAAFAGYELSLYAASFVLGASAAAFGLPVIVRLAAINAAALCGLLLLHRLCLAGGLRLPQWTAKRAVLASK